MQPESQSSLANLPLSKRPVDILLIIFFSINLFFVTYIADLEQLVISNPNKLNYPIWPPAAFVDLVRGYARTFDPVLMWRSARQRATIWIDGLFFGP